MKEIVSKSLFIALVLLSFLISTMLVNLAYSNPIGMFPTQPEPLVVTLLAPINGSRCLQGSISVAFSLKNPTLGGADSITYAIDGATKGNVNGIITEKEGERFVGFFDFLKYSATLDITGLTDGWHTLTVAAKGTSPYEPTEGGTGSIFAEVYGSDSIQFLYDVATPTVNVLIQQNHNYITSDVPLDFVISEKAAWIGYSLDERPLVTVSENTTLVELSEGIHSITVYMNDTVGRKGNSETVFFNIKQEMDEEVAEQPDTFPTVLVATATAVSVIVGLGVVVYIKKRP